MYLLSLQVLLAHGAPLFVHNIAGQTPCEAAWNAKHLIVAKLLESRMVLLVRSRGIPTYRHDMVLLVRSRGIPTYRHDMVLLVRSRGIPTYRHDMVWEGWGGTRIDTTS